MGKLTAKEVEAKAKGKIGRFADGDGLYFVVPKSGKPHWMLRFTSNKKRKEMTLAKYTDLSLADARVTASLKMQQLRQGVDPLLEKRRTEQGTIKTVDDLFVDWQEGNIKRLKHPSIPARVYRKDISPIIGEIKLDSINARDIRRVITSINDSGRPAISNDALGYCKQLFNHGIKLDLLGANPASAFTVTDAGGIEKSKDRALSIIELKFFFEKARENRDSFSRDNYLACALLVVLGVRKGELTEALWEEFDLEEGKWRLPKERSKSGVGIVMPLSESVLEWLKELQIRACGSDHVFPSRRRSKRPCMGKDTLNRAITKLFGHEAGKKKQPPNQMGEMEHFTVHDLRRTCRSLLASQGTPGHVAERCLNHKLKGVEGIYDRYDYFDEREEELEKLSIKLSTFI
ncbi:site-specific integrase [Psychromonas sp. SP041]|uniref:tyrosine-type recombinase/integrase n=1 Tax=Psychromonas sp. SP041 TaxID=1365007 RepID=UPI0003F76C8A|nr:site-specific integrase [Psychromonas sp. SP041]